MGFNTTPKFQEHAQKLKKENPKLLGKVLELIMSIEENIKEPLNGIGKPEALKGNLSGLYSRRINDKHRLVYKFDSGSIILLSCYGHYDDK